MPADSPTSSTTTEDWIGWSSRTSWRSKCSIFPRIGSTWYSLRIDACVDFCPARHDVEDRVKAVAAREHAPKLALLDTDRMRCVPAPVEDAGDQALLAQAPRRAGAPLLALLYLETDPFAGHTGGEV